MKRYGLYVILACFGVAHASQFPVKLGDTTVTIKQYRRGSGKNYVHLHHNETTALKAALTMVKASGGSVLTLDHPGERNIVFHLNEVRYEFDPNRIFSDSGIEQTLKNLGAYSKEAHLEVKHLAEAILQRIPEGKVIAVHNNESYSAHDYLAGHEYANEASKLNLDKKQFYRNFYVVTQEDDFNRLKGLRFNSILQTIHPTDDGSLSVYMSNRQYVNVEAGYDQFLAQLGMLRHA